MGTQASNGQNNYEESIATNEENDTIMWIINYLFRKDTKQKANASSIVVEDPIFIILTRIRKGECKKRE
ncbi:hypothetical protein TorRG33x02_075810 [Trema orientale]|uniref:Uncharacterized protein n=1 Tax=Trema orientale TaxID=63057 RepID=A0A2P5FFM3_TREOI|nr:hypothetical protein TorRG33x02_075810 [Trema orientale]